MIALRALPRAPIWTAIQTRIRVHPLVLIMAVAIPLRFLLLGNAALWYDETGAVWMATLPFARMLAATAGDVHPPLYLAMLWVLVRLAGTGEAVVRLPSVIASLLSIPWAWRIGERLGLSRSAVLIGALFIALAPVQIHFAQEARMYALLQFEFLVALEAALSRRWWAFGLGLGALYLTHNYGLLYALPLNLVALVGLVQYFRGNTSAPVAKSIALWWTANTCALIAWYPWTHILLTQMHEVGAGWWSQPPTVGSVFYVLYMLVWTFSMPDALQVHAALLVFGALAFAIGRAVLSRDRAALWLAVLVLLPIGEAVIASVLWHPMLLFRALLPVSPLLLMLLGWAAAQLVTARARLALAIMVAPVVITSLVGYYLYVPDEKGHPQDYINAIDWRAGDIVYHGNESSYMVMHFYTPTAWPQYLMPPAGRTLGALTESTKTAMGFNEAALDQIPRWRRAWLIWSGPPTVEASEDAAIAALLERYPHLTITERDTTLTRQGIWLLYNDGTGVP